MCFLDEHTFLYTQIHKQNNALAIIQRFEIAKNHKKISHTLKYKNSLTLLTFKYLSCWSLTKPLNIPLKLAPFFFQKCGKFSFSVKILRA